jgi:hypothetical protein
MGTQSIRLVLTVLLATAIFDWAGCTTTNAPNAAFGEAIVTRVSGNAETSVDGAHWRNAKTGDALAQTSWLRTRADAHVDVRIEPYGGVLTLMPGSVLQFAQLGRKDSSSDVVAILDLTRGRIVGDTLTLPANAKIVVRTPEGAYDIH